ncbi:protein FAM71C-like [Terrapene carolina triunguis]|uniref:protein FAM71C-like n=1 Tax=Terrapene triunguis TaxID=2587831 RepID=UPI0011565F40|nr:protein FAM71C-like [Terrapene carolina triunguis]
MHQELVLPYYTADCDQARGLMNTAMGPLQRQFRAGEYEIFQYAPIFESNFIQISKRGEVVDVHNRVRVVTVGVACTSPALLVPNVLLLARPVVPSEDSRGRRGPPAKALELTRLLPLPFVKISVHDGEMLQLRLKLASGRSFYLQLYPEGDAHYELFNKWVQIINLLRPPADGSYRGQARPGDPGEPLFRGISQDTTGSLESLAPEEGGPDALSVCSCQTPSPSRDDPESRKPSRILSPVKSLSRISLSRPHKDKKKRRCRLPGEEPVEKGEGHEASEDSKPKAKDT